MVSTCRGDADELQMICIANSLFINLYLIRNNDISVSGPPQRFPTGGEGVGNDFSERAEAGKADIPTNGFRI